MCTNLPLRKFTSDELSNYMRPEAFMATERDKIFSGNQPRQFGVEVRFRIDAPGRTTSSFL
jgi:hypothetical protein